MSSVKVLAFGKIVRDGKTEVEKKFALVFPEGEDATVALLLQRLQKKTVFADSTLSSTTTISVVAVDKDLAAEVEVDSTDKLVHLDGYTVTYAYGNADQPSGSGVRSGRSATANVQNKKYRLNCGSRKRKNETERKDAKPKKSQVTAKLDESDSDVDLKMSKFATVD